MRLSHFAVPVLAAGLVALSLTANAQSKQGKPSKADNSAIGACLKDVFEAGEKYSKLSDKQKEKAEQPAEPISCMGVVSSACQEKAKGDANKALAMCNTRELAVWSAFMDRRVAAYLKQAKPDGAAAMKKVQSAWAAYRDARCAYPALDNKDKGYAAALKSACLLGMTARQALWIDTREN